MTIRISATLSKLLRLFSLIVLASGLTMAWAQGPSNLTITPSSVTTTVPSGYLIIYGQNLTDSQGPTTTLADGGASDGLTITQTYVSAGQINLYYTLTSSAAALTTHTISVSTPGTGGGIAYVDLTVTNSLPPAPAINSGGISPWFITQGTTGTFSIYGEALYNTEGSTSVTTNGPGLELSVSYSSPTQLNVSYNAISASAGTYNVTVNTSAGSASAPLTIEP
jgi:hypothetical protein